MTTLLMPSARERQTRQTDQTGCDITNFDLMNYALMLTTTPPFNFFLGTLLQCSVCKERHEQG